MKSDFIEQIWNYIFSLWCHIWFFWHEILNLSDFGRKIWASPLLQFSAKKLRFQITCLTSDNFFLFSETVSKNPFYCRCVWVYANSTFSQTCNDLIKILKLPNYYNHNGLNEYVLTLIWLLDSWHGKLSSKVSDRFFFVFFPN
jgi:hypothetical protein